MPKIPPLGVPRELRDALNGLAGLSNEAFESLLAAVAEVDAKVPARQVAEELALRTEGMVADDIASIIELAVSVSSLAQVLKADRTETAAAVAASATDVNNEVLARRLDRLSASGPLILRSEAQSLISDHQYTFRSVRVLSDIRPRFPREDDELEAEPPRGAVITHTLKLEYAGNERHTVYIAVSSANLRTIEAAISRAIKKDSALTALLTNAGVDDLTPKSDDV